MKKEDIKKQNALVWIEKFSHSIEEISADKSMSESAKQLQIKSAELQIEKLKRQVSEIEVSQLRKVS